MARWRADDSRQRSGSAGWFARDVAVNVIANLVAAAIIYLVGVAAGLLPKSPDIYVTAIVIVLFAGGLAIYAVGKFYFTGRNETRAIAISMIALGLVGPLVSLAPIASGLSRTDKLEYSALGAAMIITGILFLLPDGTKSD